MAQVYESDVTDEEAQSATPEDKIYEDSEFAPLMREEIERQEEPLSEEEKWKLGEEDSLPIEEIE